MREPSMNNIQKDEILRKCFDYFVKYGLESISMRKMCDETGMAMSSVYYWFGNKDGAIMNATEWGFEQVADSLFDFVFKHIDNLECSIIMFSEIVMKYKKELRFVYQVVTSEKYGDRMRHIANRISLVYEDYAEALADHLKVTKYQILPYVHLFVSAVLDYVIWNDKEKIEMELACLYKNIRNLGESNE